MLTRVVVSGEGITDMGQATNGQRVAHNEYIAAGPCLVMLRRLLTRYLPEWNQGQQIHETYIYRAHLGEKVRTFGFRFPGKKVVKNHLEHLKRACALGLLAKEYSD